MPADPLVSVVVPVFNGGHFLVEALDSVVQQAYRPLELIVVNDGSTDATAQTVADYAGRCPVPLHAVEQENRGPAAARNRGLALAQGEIVAFQDADDLWAANRLPVQLALLERFSAALAVLGRTRFFFDDATTFSSSAAARAADSAPRWFLGIHSGLYRRAAFDINGQFNADLRYHEDIDWFRRARATGLAIYPHEDVVLLHRRHAANMTNDRTALRADLLRMLRRSPHGQATRDDSLLAWLTTKPAQ
jgi:glycosyltransferase involved in cell wall biosynthesis